MSEPQRVLIVDDNLMNLDLVTFILEAASFEVSSAPDAVTALDRIPRFKPDLILMDVQMPGMDGLELTHRLKADPATSHIVIVAFTAYAMKGDQARMLAAGCDGYISKPIDVANFVSTLRACLAEVRGVVGPSH
jgi:two-component system cell cycle response regulator DivK